MDCHIANLMKMGGKLVLSTVKYQLYKSYEYYAILAFSAKNDTCVYETLI